MIGVGGVSHKHYPETKGLKAASGQLVKKGTILTRQGDKWKAGLNVAGKGSIQAACDGTVYFTGQGETAGKARAMVEEMTHEFKVGEMLKGAVVKIADFGAFVRLNPYVDGLVHISEMAPFRVERVSDIIKEGMMVPVKVIKIDEERGKISLSIKEADKNFFNGRK